MPGAMLTYASAAGPLTILIPFAIMLWGIMAAQVYYYWAQYKDDAKWIKALVYTMSFFETAHSFFCLHLLYSYVVTSGGDSRAVSVLVWSSGVTLYLEMIVVFLAQGFYIYRIWQLSEGYLPVTIIPGVLLCFRCAFGIATASLTYEHPDLRTFKSFKAVVVTVNVGLSLAVLVDLVITASLIYYLGRRSSSFSRTRRVIHSLMLYIVNTGALSIIFSVLTLLSFNLVLSSLFACFVQVVCKLYGNSMLAMLNARKKIKKAASFGSPNTVPQFVDMGPHGRKRDSIKVSVMHETITDEDRPEEYLDAEENDANETQGKVTYSIV